MIKRTFWPQERIDRMMVLWVQGYSATEIGRDIGMTRSAVLGKLFRMRRTFNNAKRAA